MNRNKLPLFFFLIATSLTLSAQTSLEDLKKIRGSSNEVLKAARIEIPNKTAYVMLNPDYPVTPGDTYTINYLYNLKATTLPFFIESDYTANLSFFGKINTKGMTFRQLRTNIENRALKAYPDSLPRLTIESTGAFPVLVAGEVKAPGFAHAWGFSRLSELLADRLTSYSSIRDVEMIYEDGRSEVYDLYQAALSADLTKNPVVPPGTKIIVHRLQREIFIRGEVHREGAFQILPSENLKTALDVYAGGCTNLAEPTQAYILRLLADNGSAGTIYADLTKLDTADIPLKNMDIIVVPSRAEKLPVVFFEGALFMKIGENSPVSARVPWPITSDQRISTALNNLPSGAITPVSDLERAFIIRRGSSKFSPVNLAKIYYDHDLSGDIALCEGDRIIIPPKYFTVMVGGAVHNPGPVPYVAGKKYLEYVQLAGGFNVEDTTGKRVVIIDRDGVRHGADRIIEPEDKIYIPKDSFNYWFTKRVGPIIGTTAAILGVILSVNEILTDIWNATH